MKKVDNKGFMLVETLIVATLIISVLIYLFIQFQTIAKSYNTSFNYNTVDAAYGVSNIRNYILSDGYEELLNYQNTANNGYVDITNCNSEYFEETEYCLSLFDQLNVKTVLFTKNNLSNLKSKNFTFNEKLKSFINYIKYDNEKVYRIIVEYKNGTFGSLKVTESYDFICGQYFVDRRDGNSYKTVKIGEQCWMAENLRYKCANFKDVGIDSANWTASADACAPQGNGYNGILYQWRAAMNGGTEGAKGLCPDGWHIPTDLEWTTLTDFVGETPGTKLKAMTSIWDGTNTVGFNAEPAGYRISVGSLDNVGSDGDWWTSSVSDSLAWARYLISNNSDVGRYSAPQDYGFSVRCLLGQ